MGSALVKRKTYKGMATFEDLPREVQVRIFSEFYLHELLDVITVCKSWKDLAYDPALWKSVSLNISDHEEARVESIMTGLRRCTMLRSLTLSDFSTISMKYIETGIVGKLFEFLVTTFPDIEHVSLSNFNSLTSESLMLLGRLKNLKSLHLPREHGQAFTPESISTVVNSCTHLETLNLHGTEVKADILRYICETRGDTLKNLTVYCAELRDDDISCFQKSPNLSHLFMNVCSHLTDGCFQHLKNLKSIKQLKINYSKKFTSKGFGVLCSGATAKSLQSLKLTHIDGLDDDCLRQVVTKCPKLKFVSYEGNCKITEQGLIKIRSGAKCEIRDVPYRCVYPMRRRCMFE